MLRNSPSMKSLFCSRRPGRLGCRAERSLEVIELKNRRATLTMDTLGRLDAPANLTELSSAIWILRARIEPSTSMTPGAIRKKARALAGSGGMPGVKHALGMMVRGVEGLLQ